MIRYLSASDSTDGYWCAAVARGNRIVWQDRAAKEANYAEFTSRQ